MPIISYYDIGTTENITPLVITRKEAGLIRIINK